MFVFEISIAESIQSSEVLIFVGIAICFCTVFDCGEIVVLCGVEWSKVPRIIIPKPIKKIVPIVINYKFFAIIKPNIRAIIYDMQLTQSTPLNSCVKGAFNDINFTLCMSCTINLVNSQRQS